MAHPRPGTYQGSDDSFRQHTSCSGWIWCRILDERKSKLTDSQQKFAERIVRRKGLFIVLSFAGLIGAAAVIAYCAIRRFYQPGFEFAPRLVIAVLILLNSRQNLRQYRVASILESLGVAQ